MKLGIVIPVLNQYEKAVDAIASIRTVHNYEIKIISQYRQQLPLAGAWNRGLEWSLQRHHSLTLIINDDILFTPQCIDNLVSSFLELEQEYKCVMVTGNNVRGLYEDPLHTLEYATDVKSYQECPDFACFMVRPTIKERIGPFDENFSPAYFEDNDYHYRINLAGLRAFNAVSAPYYHYGSQTQNADVNIPVVSPIYFDNNRDYYIAKWGGPPASEIFQTPFNDPNMKLNQWNPGSSSIDNTGLSIINMLNGSC